jgi:hypothetical protein
MADIPPINPGVPIGAAPPPKKETGKVQPKKETVRINLPPKPTAAPTIKLPTLPPGGPTGASSGTPLPIPGGPSALRSSAAPVAASRMTAAAPAAAPAAQRSAIARVPVAAKISTFDKILAIAACLTALAAVGTTVWMMMILNAAISPQ